MPESMTSEKGKLGWLVLSVLVIVLDQITKYIAEHTLPAYEPLAVLPSFNLTLMYNTGAAFSFLASAGGWQRWFFITLASVVSIVIVVWMARLPRARHWEAASLALILGGAIGNVIDRIVHGHVIDFIQVYYDTFYWPAFNIADSAITVGVIMLLWQALMDARRHSRERDTHGPV